MDTLKSYYETWCAMPQPRKVKVLKAAAFVCYSLFLLFVVIYGFGGTGRKSKSLTPTVVFMQAMPADLQALRYLLQRRDVSVAMVVLSVNGWVANLDAAYENVAAFVQTLKREGLSRDIPMYYGNSVAAVDESFFTKIVYVAGTYVPATTTACTYRRVLPQSLTVPAQRLFGGAMLLDLVNVSDAQRRLAYYAEPLHAYLSSHRASFLVLGPCTDPAAFLQAYPNLRGQVDRIVVAGGAFIGMGDVQYIYPENRVAETNFFLDPAAADYILAGGHGRPVMAVSRDAAEPWDPAAYATMVESRTSTAASSEAEVTSADVVGVALDGYYRRVGFLSKPVPVAILAASLLADAYLLNGATVSSIYAHVIAGQGLVKDGASIRVASGAGLSSVVTKVDTATFNAHMLRVDALPLT